MTFTFNEIQFSITCNWHCDGLAMPPRCFPALKQEMLGPYMGQAVGRMHSVSLTCLAVITVKTTKGKSYTTINCTFQSFSANLPYVNSAMNFILHSLFLAHYGLHASCWTYAQGTLPTHKFAFICVCVVKLNQGSIWATLMEVIVLSACLCVWADRESV